MPRYRQRVRGVPARLAGPVWVDDENFDLTYHVRRSALPRPGTLEQLREFVGRILARRLDRSRPLWEMYLVEGLEDNRFALVAKSHLALVNGIDTVDIGQVLLDASRPEPHDMRSGSRETTPGIRCPSRPSIELVVGALWESAQDPAQAVENLRGTLTGALGRGGRGGGGGRRGRRGPGRAGRRRAPGPAPGRVAAQPDWCRSSAGYATVPCRWPT